MRCQLKDNLDCCEVSHCWGALSSPISVQHLPGVGVDYVDNDASVTPASLEQVVVLVALSRMEGLVEESPRQLLLSMNLKGSACSHANVLPPKVAVFFISVIQSNQQCVEL